MSVRRGIKIEIGYDGAKYKPWYSYVDGGLVGVFNTEEEAILAAEELARTRSKWRRYSYRYKP